MSGQGFGGFAYSPSVSDVVLDRDDTALLPDTAARRHLFDLYRGRLDIDESNLDDAVAELLDTRNAMTRVLLGAGP